MRLAIASVILVLAASTAAAEPAATRRLMRRLASGALAPPSLVDPDTGIVVITYMQNEDDEHPFTRSARRLCGTRAIAELASRRAYLRDVIRMDEIFSCRNRPGPPTCTMGIAGEYAGTSDYIFRVTPAGALVLDTILSTNSVYRPGDFDRVVARLRAAHAGGRCAP